MFVTVLKKQLSLGADKGSRRVKGQVPDSLLVYTCIKLILWILLKFSFITACVVQLIFRRIFAFH
jgi:hypothetical protein